MSDVIHHTTPLGTAVEITITAHLEDWDKLNWSASTDREELCSGTEALWTGRTSQVQFDEVVEIAKREADEAEAWLVRMRSPGKG